MKKKPKNEGELGPPMSPDDFVLLVKETKYSKNSPDPYKWEQKLTDYRRVQNKNGRSVLPTTNAVQSHHF